MTDLKFEILKKLYQLDPQRIKYGDMVNEYLKLHRLNECRAAVKDLEEDKYIKFENGQEYITLTREGKRAYETEDEMRKQRAENERCNKKNQTIAIVAAVAACAAALISLIQFLHSFFQ